MPESATDLRMDAAEPRLRSLKGELLLLIAAQARRVTVEVMVTAALVAALVTAYVPPVIPLAWLLVVLASTLLHTRVVGRLPDDTSSDEDRRLRVAAWSFGIHGAILASLLAVFPWLPVTIGTVLTIFNIGLCTATIPGVAGWRRIFLPYALVTLGPVALVWALSPTLQAGLYERLIFVGMVLGYLTAMLGHAKGAWAVFTESYDIRSQRLELNRKLREALTHAEAANRAKTRFLASASHDLRQPIHALSLFSGSLLLRQMDARTADIAGQIDKAIKALASQLDALLDISRLDAGVIEKTITTVDLHALLAHLQAEFAPQARQRGLRLAVNCARQTLVLTDAGLLERVLRNLLSNAIKYTMTGGVDLIVTPVGDGARFRVAVRDSGIGIPLAERERVFEEFYQLHNPERDRTKGLGLGLAIVRRLTELLGLQLRVESALGVGSEFSVEIPAAQPQASPPHENSCAPGRAATQIDVLVIDDEEAIRLGMITLLEELGYGVLALPSTETALKAAAESRPSIVLADFRLRGEDNGLQAIRALRRRWPDLPALLISGDTAPERLREAHAAGVELLHKPVNAATLHQSILRAISP